MHNSRIKRISLAVCLAVMPFTAHALGMGKMTVLSGLGEPLNAEIELLAPTKEELSNLAARIAPAQTYADQGIDRPAMLNHIKVDLVSNPSRPPMLKLTTQRPVNDPFLDMLIQVEWSSGQLLREYTALLDPPNYVEYNAAEAVVTQPAVLSEAPTAAKPSMPQAKGKKGKIKKRAAGTEAASEKATSEDATLQGGELGSSETATIGGETYKVHSGDTLHGIAQRMQVEGVSLDQMLVGLFRGNKDAFAGKNMNRLKVGKILKVPDVETLQAVSQQEAVREIRVQTADWNAYRNNLAAKVAESAPVSDETAEGRAATGKITGPAEDKAAPPAPGPRDVVKLSKSDVGAATATSPQGKAAGAQETAAAQKEDAIARDKTIKEANDRVAALEKQLQEMQKLLQLKNPAVAEAQPGTSPESAGAKPESADKPVAETPPAAPEQPALSTVPAEAQPAATPPVASDSAKKPPIKPVAPQPQPEPGVLDSLSEDPLLPAGIGALLIAALGGAWFYRRSKRKKGLDAFEQSILTTGGLKSNTVFGNTAGGVVDTSDISFVTDFSHGSGAGMIDTSDVDPIAEAEVYMAYGRDAQAEEILKDAIAKEPTRYELHQKMLEIYANRNDSSAFEALAGELYTTLGANDPHWVKVAEMGRKIEPENPLYSSDTAHGVGNDSKATGLQLGSADDLSSTGPVPVGPGSSIDEAAEQSPEEGLLDFDLSADQSTNNLPFEKESEASKQQSLVSSSAVPESVDTSNEIAALDFSLDLTRPDTPESIAHEPSDVALDFGLSGDASTIISPAVAEPASLLASNAIEGPEISFDLPQIGDVLLQPPADDVKIDAPASVSSREEVPAVTMKDLEQAMHFDSLLNEEAGGPEQIVLEPAAEEPAASSELIDFSFDLDQTVSAGADKKAEPELPAASLDIDLSGISLDFEESAPSDLPAPHFEMPAKQADEIFPKVDMAAFGLEENQAAGTALQPSLGGAESESSDVETKLDLVTAYLDMGDTAGARELLDEVLKEGGPGQRRRAQALVESIG